MCGRFTSTTPAGDLAAWFGGAEVLDPDPGPRWNVAPTDPVWALAARDGSRRLRLLRWGLVPGWARDASGAARHINARAETLAERPAFRAAFARRRCLVPADGFYEWRPGPGRARQPWYLRAAAGGPLAFGGLYEAWRDPRRPDEAGGLLRTCAIVTTAANPDVAPLHDRMPLVLGPEAWEAWLSPATSASDLRALLAPAPPGTLAAHPVAPLVNDVRRDGPDLVVRPLLEASLLED